jgi:uncharacterized protein YlxW (UPF0749 family)
MKKLSLMLCLAALMTAPLFAKDKKNESAPVLSEVEQLKVENLQLKFAPLARELETVQKEMRDLQQKYEDMRAQIESEYPGYTFSADGKSLVKKPAPPPDPAKP